ncbi:MAG: BON domain-containing protein [Alphaproteobacteria bacterium]|nr:BON domain-containing protein [Alphaproteobacteria bacterium]
MKLGDDLQLQQRVIDELTFDPSVNAAHIGVAARNGIVTLSGHVGSVAEKFAAERAARRIKGVKAIAQEIEVHLPPDKKTDDDEIAARAVKMLAWDVLIPAGAIDVEVEHGVITLSGTVQWGYQRDEAERDLRRLGGVKGVVNIVAVRPRVDAADIEASLHAAFERSADLEASGITVAVKGGRVVLAGKVRSWIEREEAERAAWSVPGVTAVDDRIAITRP